MADVDIKTAAAEPKSASNDGQQVEAHPLPDLVEADKHLAASTSASQPHRGLRFTKLVPPGGA